MQNEIVTNSRLKNNFAGNILDIFSSCSNSKTAFCLNKKSKKEILDLKDNLDILGYYIYSQCGSNNSNFKYNFYFQDKLDILSYKYDEYLNNNYKLCEKNCFILPDNDYIISESNEPFTYQICKKLEEGYKCKFFDTKKDLNFLKSKNKNNFFSFSDEKNVKKFFFEKIDNISLESKSWFFKDEKKIFGLNTVFASIRFPDLIFFFELNSSPLFFLSYLTYFIMVFIIFLQLSSFYLLFKKIFYKNFSKSYNDFKKNKRRKLYRRR